MHTENHQAQCELLALTRNIAYVNARAVLKPGDLLRVTKCPGTKRWITFAGWDGHWIVSKSGINDYAPGSVDKVNETVVDFKVETTEAWEWYETYSRSRRLRLGPCPDRESGNYSGLHELTVAECFEDDLSHVYCTCGWVGPGAKTDECAVALHNKPYGFSIEPMSEWVVHKNVLPDLGPCDLPF